MTCTPVLKFLYISLLLLCVTVIYMEVKDVQQLLKGVVSPYSIVLIKLPRHVSASKCELHGGYTILS
jgi:hypothetical protein